MNIVPILSTVIVVATLATLMLAIGSYLAFKLRERRRPKPKAGTAAAPEKTFFVRYQPPPEGAAGGSA
jgi:hypothetical protein